MDKQQIINNINTELKAINLEDFEVYEKDHSLYLKENDYGDLLYFSSYDTNSLKIALNGTYNLRMLFRKIKYDKSVCNAIDIFCETFANLMSSKGKVIEKLQKEYKEYKFFLFDRKCIRVYKDNDLLAKVYRSYVEVNEDVFEILRKEDIIRLYDITRKAQEEILKLEDTNI